MKNNYFSYTKSFLEYLQYELHYSSKTVITYERALQHFNIFLQKNHYSFLTINDQIANQYKAYLIGQKYENKTSSLFLSAIRSFYHYLVEIKIVRYNAFLNLKNPKISKKLPNFLNQKEIGEMFLNLEYQSDLELRNVLMIEFLYVSGLRVSELCNIKLNDINPYEKTIKILGKGSKERIIFYKAIDASLFEKYLTTTRNNILKGKTSEYLFISLRGNALSTRSVENIVKQYAQKKNIKSKVTPHTMRHTYATDLLNYGADIRSVGELLGHSSLSTTQIYTHVTSERLKNVYKKTHPREILKK